MSAQAIAAGNVSPVSLDRLAGLVGAVQSFERQAEELEVDRLELELVDHAMPELNTVVA
jgi:hypothetical protein